MCSNFFSNFTNVISEILYIHFEIHESSMKHIGGVNVNNTADQPLVVRHFQLKENF